MFLEVFRLFPDRQVLVQIYKAVGLKCSEQVLEAMLLQRKLRHLWTSISVPKTEIPDDNLLHAVGKSWRRGTPCSYPRSCDLLLNRSILPEASVPCLWQFKHGPCRLVYKWSA